MREPVVGNCLSSGREFCSSNALTTCSRTFLALLYWDDALGERPLRIPQASDQNLQFLPAKMERVADIEPWTNGTG